MFYTPNANPLHTRTRRTGVPKITKQRLTGDARNATIVKIRSPLGHSRRGQKTNITHPFGRHKPASSTQPILQNLDLSLIRRPGRSWNVITRLTESTATWSRRHQRSKHAARCPFTGEYQQHMSPYHKNMQKKKRFLTKTMPSAFRCLASDASLL